ncbi:hypothetical protein CIK90_00665 [Prevotella sp. P5-126]|nr:hypothetical protein CIK90_00665 [Prevotella sp. P5-126]
MIHKQKRAESSMVSLAQGNTLRKSAFSVKIFLKILFPYKFRLISDDNNPRNTRNTQKKILVKDFL